MEVLKRQLERQILFLQDSDEVYKTQKKSEIQPENATIFSADKIFPHDSSFFFALDWELMCFGNDIDKYAAFTSNLREKLRKNFF